jgi:hypothetical protein
MPLNKYYSIKTYNTGKIKVNINQRGKICRFEASVPHIIYSSQFRRLFMHHWLQPTNAVA